MKRKIVRDVIGLPWGGIAEIVIPPDGGEKLDLRGRLRPCSITLEEAKEQLRNLWGREVSDEEARAFMKYYNRHCFKIEPLDEDR